MDPKTIYSNTLAELLVQQKKLMQKRSFFGIMRFGSVAAIIAAFYFLWSIGLVWAFVAALILLVIFVQLVYKDLSNKAAIKQLGHLIAINEDELKAMEGTYFQFADGAAYLPKEHPYAADIDIFGHASLYQFVNRSTSDMGAAELARWLLFPAKPEEILERQAGIKEIKEKMLWRQDIQAYGKETNIRRSTFQKLIAWLNEPTIFLQFHHWQWIRIVLPAIILSVVAATIAGWLSLNTMYAFLFFFAVIAFQVNKYVAPLHEKLSKIVAEMDALSLSIAAIEKEKFSAAFSLRQQQNFISGTGTASWKIKKLKKILDRLDIRYNIVLSAPLNLLLLWNLQQALDLEQWKKQYAADVESWFHTLGVFEALNSFAVVHFNNPGWCFPTLHEEHFFLESTELGHPLINKNKRVDNFINMEKKGELMLVTGSNMAGKSTYLRSVGINVVLAMAGAPVCAASLRLSPVQLISSMRIADNLEESTSTFYAELKKLKAVIDKVNKNEKVFILLDEILRGTNSLDRHTGSEALIKQLIKHEAAGIIATHDLGLADIKNEFPANILNYHFDVQVNNEELYFDYKLKPGVCTSLNASILMKKIGIEL
ncbi:MAG: hypothetical protein ABI741_11415 [Ferruginibacter sp.]